MAAEGLGLALVLKDVTPRFYQGFMLCHEEAFSAGFMIFHSVDFIVCCWFYAVVQLAPSPSPP